MTCPFAGIIANKIIIVFSKHILFQYITWAHSAIKFYYNRMSSSSADFFAMMIIMNGLLVNKHIGQLLFFNK